MVRIARVVAPGLPHQLTQRGNRRPETVVCDDEYRAYIHRMSQWCARWQVDVWAYCLMLNHVHLLVVPESEAGRRHAVGKAHRRYARRLNVREGWQGRCASFPMDERSLLAAARDVERNPVWAGLVKTPHAYRWSSTPAHIAGRNDALVGHAPTCDGGQWEGAACFWPIGG